MATDHGFTLAFMLAAGASFPAALASIAAPPPPRRQFSGRLASEPA